MQLKGLDQLREKLPNYPGKRIVFLPLRGIVAAVVAYMFLIVLDVLPRLFGDVAGLVIIEPFLPFIGSVFIGWLSFWLIGRVWNQREKLKAEYGNLAYQHIIPTGVVGVALIPPIVFHAFTSISSLPPVPPASELTVLWSQSLLSLIGIPSEIDFALRVLFAGALIVLGILVVRSAINTFGVDYMTVVYLYFPEESEVQNHQIYSVLRHPTYFGAMLFGLAALAFQFSVYSISIFVVVYLLLRMHIRREEKELVERFGESYSDYMKAVPALHIRLRQVRTFFKFLRE